MNLPFCAGVSIYAQSITSPSHHPPYEPHSSVLLLAVGCAVGLGSAILPLKTNGLIDEEVTQARVASRADGKGNDDTCKKMSETEHSAGDGSQGLTEGEQLGRDLAKAPQALRDGMSCFSGRDVSTGLVQVYSRGRVAGGRLRVLSSFNGSRTRLFLLLQDTQHRQSVTDAIDGISARKGPAATDRADIPARGSSGAPLGGTPAEQLAWETW
jgi:hypothetical protein